jgi:CDP-paratose 2-epimerase
VKILITGSSGLVGSEAVAHFDRQGHSILGIDNNLRMDFFGSAGDTRWNLDRLRKSTRDFTHFEVDIRNREAVFGFFKEQRPDAIFHCAAQPSHDLASSRPLDDFDVNAGGTLNLLEACRQFTAESPFAFMSTNKVYGDAPNEIPLTELKTRWDYARDEDHNGVDETCRIDRCKHSLFGASKAAADIMTQEYGIYFGMPTACFRGGCLTGPHHSAVELHGFLSYLVKVAVAAKPFTIFGYKGKQVRDQLHSLDVVGAAEAFFAAPRTGEVYNLGGGRANSASVLECIAKVETLSSRKIETSYVEQNREGDHICYISDIGKLQSHYPEWKVSRSLDSIIEEIYRFEVERESSS